MEIPEEVRRVMGSPNTQDEHLYAQALRELESGEPREGLWAKAISDSQGDERKCVALYLKLRVQSLKEEQSIRASLAKREARLAANREEELRQEREQQRQEQEKRRAQEAIDRRRMEVRRKYGRVGLIVYTVGKLLRDPFYVLLVPFTIMMLMLIYHRLTTGSWN